MKRWFRAVRFGLTLFVTLVATLTYADSRDLEFDVQPLFEGKVQPSGVQPMLIKLGNRGPDARGVVLIRKDGFMMRYPIELPQGSTKEFVAYTSSSDHSFGPSQFSLQTDRGSLQIRRDPSDDGSSWIALAIADMAGGASALAQSGPSQNQLMDVYGRPGRLPDRAVGYAGCGVILLGEGSERLSDREVAAIQEYVLLGGSVLVTGGASTPVLLDPRWRDWIPIEPGKPKTISARGPGPLGLKPVGEFTITPGTLRKGAVVMHRYANENFVIKRTVGKGRIVFVAANLFESPARNWDGVDAFFSKLNFTMDGMLLANLGSRSYDPYYSSSSWPGSSFDVANDPFQTSLPATSVIIGILVIYFVLVVPVNLLVLRKLGRGELAWVTSPLISLVFAAIFFQFASGLYSANLTTAVSGIWVVDELVPRGQFVGKAQIFIPRGGSYDLGLEDVGYIAEGAGYDYRHREGRLFNDLRAQDDGQIRVTNMAARNLSFHEFSFQQAMPGGKLFAVSTTARTLTYNGQVRLSGVRLITTDGVINVGELAPRATVKLGKIGLPNPLDDATRKRLAPGQVVILGRAPTLAAGPKLGNERSNLNTITLEAYGSLEGKL